MPTDNKIYAAKCCVSFLFFSQRGSPRVANLNSSPARDLRSFFSQELGGIFSYVIPINPASALLIEFKLPVSDSRVELARGTRMLPRNVNYVSSLFSRFPFLPLHFSGKCSAWCIQRREKRGSTIRKSLELWSGGLLRESRH